MITQNNIKLDFSSQNISSDGGIVLMDEFCKNIELKKILDAIPFFDARFNPKYSNTDIMYNRIINTFCGYSNQVVAEKSREDVLMQFIMKNPSQPTLSRIYERVNGFTNAYLNVAILELVKPLLNKQDVLIFDADSTYVECNGKQELSARNAHYNCHGFNPLLITEHNTKVVLAAELKPGNTVCSEGLDELLDFLSDHIDFKSKKIILRADSAFSNKKHIDMYEKHNFDYTVKLKRNKKLVTKIEEIMINKLISDDDMEVGKTHYAIVDYNSPTYGNLKLYVKGVTELDDQVLLFPEYQVIVSNIDDTPEKIFDLYNERGSSEIVFRDLKNDFSMDTLSHTEFEKNRFDFLMSCFNYNLFRLFKEKVAIEYKSKTLSVFIREFVKIGTKISFSARQYKFSYSASYRYKKEFKILYSRL